MTIQLENVIWSMQYYLDCVRFIKEGYYQTVNAEVMAAVPENPPGVFIYQATKPRWCYTDPLGTLTVPAVIVPGDHQYINYEKGQVAYNYDVVTDTGNPPVASYTHRIIDFRNGDVASEEQPLLGNIVPPCVIMELISDIPGGGFIGSSDREQERYFSFDVYARNPSDKSKLRKIFADAFSPRHHAEARVINFDTILPLDNDGDINALFDATAQDMNYMYFSDNRMENFPTLGVASANDYRFRYNIVVKDVE